MWCASSCRLDGQERGGMSVSSIPRCQRWPKKECWQRMELSGFQILAASLILSIDTWTFWILTSTYSSWRTPRRILSIGQRNWWTKISCVAPMHWRMKLRFARCWHIRVNHLLRWCWRKIGKRTWRPLLHRPPRRSSESSKKRIRWIRSKTLPVFAAPREATSEEPCLHSKLYFIFTLLLCRFPWSFCKL